MRCWTTSPCLPHHPKKIKPTNIVGTKNTCDIFYRWLNLRMWIPYCLVECPMSSMSPIVSMCQNTNGICVAPFFFSRLNGVQWWTWRVYKKTSPNSVLTLYLGTRDIICRQGNVQPLRGVIFVDPKYAASHKVYGQLTLTFR